MIRQARLLRGQTQAEVAAELGYHQSKISRLENGTGTEDLRTLHAVASVLDIPLRSLGLASASDPPPPHEIGDMHRRSLLAASIATLAGPAPPQEGVGPDLVRALLPGPFSRASRSAAPYSGGYSGGPPGSVRSPSRTEDASTRPPAPPQRLAARVAHARALFSTCRYAELGRVLPGLLDELRQAQLEQGDGELAGLLATAYQTTASLLLKLGDQGSAWLAVGRAICEAERSGEPVVMASSVRVQVHALARERHTAPAVMLVRHTAEQLAGRYDRRPPEYLAALGLMLLRGVTAASSGGDRAATAEFLAEAREVAKYVNLDRPDVWANFSPTNVELHYVSAAVALGDAGAALEAARPLMCRRIPVPERRAALWVDAARAYAQQGRLIEGYQALRIAEGCASEDIRRPATRELAADLVARDRRGTLPELRRFCEELGVPT